MKNSRIYLVFFLGYSIILTGCDFFCGCPPNEGSYFNIQGIERIDHMEQVTNSSVSAIPDGARINFDDYSGISIKYSVTYLSQDNQSEGNGPEVLYACTCSNSGEAGSKNELLKQITVVTLHDFNSTYQANDTINSLISVAGIPLDEYLAQNNDLIKYPSLQLKLIEAPSLDERFKVKVILELSTGEIYEAETSTVILEQ